MLVVGTGAVRGGGFANVLESGTRERRLMAESRGIANTDMHVIVVGIVVAALVGAAAAAVAVGIAISIAGSSSRDSSISNSSSSSSRNCTH